MSFSLEGSESRPASKPPAWKVRAVLLVGIFGISAASILTRWLGELTIAATAVAGHRMLLAGLLTTPSALRHRPGGTQRPPIPRVPLVCAALALALHFGTYTEALYSTSVARVVLLVSTQPVFVLLVSWWSRGEKPRPRLMVALAVVALGISIMVLPEGVSGPGARGDLLALVSGASLAAYLLFGERLRACCNVARYTAPLYILSGAILLSFTLLTGANAWPSSGQAWLLLTALAVIPTLAGHTAFHWALQSVGATTVSIAFLGEIPGASLLAWWILGEQPNRWTWIGGLLCWAGVTALLLVQPRARTG